MKLARSFAFARHIPPRQIAARLWLEARRRWAMRVPPKLAARAQPVAAPPPPIFPPRTGMIARQDNGWRFTFIGRNAVMGKTIDWHAEPDQLWRMNLHYMEYLEEIDSAAGLDLIRQWIAANPPFRPNYWRDSWNSYALSLRVVVWMQRLAAWGVAPDDVVASLTAQLDFLLRNLETDIGGNHLIKNIKALAWGGAFFAAPFGDTLRAKAAALLAKELPRQILPDGMHYERSPSYHAQVFADLIEIRAALGDGALDPLLARMAAATAALAHPDGGPTQFNDAGLTMAYAPDACLRAYAQPVAAPAGAFALRDAGYFGFHAPRVTVIADMGRIGPDDLPAHAHGDIGSVELSWDGARIVVDQGVFEYVAGDRRQAARSAHSHNCLAIDGAEPADFYGAFRCGRRPDVTVTDYAGGPDSMLLEGHHNGYRDLPGRPELFRRIEASADRVAITDRIVSRAWHAATARLLLHPDCSVSCDGAVATVRRGRTTLTFRASLPWRVEPALWWPDMGIELATQRLCLTLPPGCFEAAVEIAAEQA